MNITCRLTCIIFFVFVLISLRVFVSVVRLIVFKSFSLIFYYYVIFSLLCRTVFSYLFHLCGMLKYNYQKSKCFYSGGWQESLGIIMSVAVGFLYTLNDTLCSSLEMVTSRKLLIIFIYFFLYSKCHCWCYIVNNLHGRKTETYCH
jgi:hypothetical protein